MAQDARGLGPGRLQALPRRLPASVYQLGQWRGGHAVLAWRLLSFTRLVAPGWDRQETSLCLPSLQQAALAWGTESPSLSSVAPVLVPSLHTDSVLCGESGQAVL